MEEVDDNVVQIVTNVYGDVCLRKQRRKRQKLLITEMFYDYAKNTTLHGIPYITRRGVSLVEKVFWMVTFLISLALCSYWIYQVWVKWKTSPVIVTVSEHLVPVAMVPFPSVTICPQSKVKTSLYNYTEQVIFMRNVWESLLDFNDTKTNFQERFNRFEDLSQICDYYNILKWFYGEDYTNYTSVQNINNVSLDYEDVFETSNYLLGCTWRNETMNCNDIFQKVLTQEGVCYNFNSLGANEILRQHNVSGIQQDYEYIHSNKESHGWTMEHGYENLTDGNSYPRHGMENGAIPDLVVVFRSNSSDRDYSCRPTSSGFKVSGSGTGDRAFVEANIRAFDGVYVQHPLDLPQSSLYYYAVLDGQVSSMALSFSILNTSEALRSTDAKVRQCYFPSDKYLKYFKMYTAQNCRMECLTNYTYEKCGCVRFYMPFNRSDRICTTLQNDCMIEAEEQLVYNELISDEGCNCLPACVSIDYEAEILKTEYNLHKYYETTGRDEALYAYNGSFSSLNFSKLEMYFKKSRFISMRRSELFGSTDFLANCGGLLGLFLGFSFLSLVEIFFFLTLRLWCTLKKDFDQEKAERANETTKPENKKF